MLLGKEVFAFYQKTITKWMYIDNIFNELAITCSRSTSTSSSFSVREKTLRSATMSLTRCKPLKEDFKIAQYITVTHEKEDGLKAVKLVTKGIDALVFKFNQGSQFGKTLIKREILKAYAGFKFSVEGCERVVSGNWGCGAFGGDLRTKLLIQWLACSMAGKELVYCPFGQRQKVNDQ